MCTTFGDVSEQKSEKRVRTSLGSKLLSRALSVKQDERIEVFSSFVVFQSSIDALGAGFMLGMIEGLVVGIRLFAAASCNLLKVVLHKYVSRGYVLCVEQTSNKRVL